jgi:hypothetical protein
LLRFGFLQDFCIGKEDRVLCGKWSSKCYVESGVPSETVEGRMLELLSIDVCLI